MAKTFTLVHVTADGGGEACLGAVSGLTTEDVLAQLEDDFEKYPDALLFAGSPIPWQRTIQIGEPKERKRAAPAADRSCPSVRVLLTVAQVEGAAVPCPKCGREFHPRVGKNADGALAATIKAHAPVSP